MKISRHYGIILSILLTCAVIPAPLVGFDFPGYVTMRGKIIDADTLKPIEGAVVWARWHKCRPSVGGDVCDVYKVKEVLTDANGEWLITGRSGTFDPCFLRVFFGFLVAWVRPPWLGYYKPGYYPYLARLEGGDFSARAYVDRSKNLEGILLYRPGDTEEEVTRYLEQWKKNRCEMLIPVKDPERKLRELDFDFQYPPNVICVHDIKDSKLIRLYKVIGLKRAVTPEEKRKARVSLPSTTTLYLSHMPLLRKALEEH